MEIKNFGTTARGEQVTMVTIIDYGGTIVSIRTPDRNGNIVDVSLGYDNVAGYETNGGYIGALIGRVGNRIDKGRFTLNGKDYQLAINNGENHLHGGLVGFDRKVWKATVEGEKLILELFSADGEENYPGNLNVKVIYYMVGDELVLEYFAQSDADTLRQKENKSIDEIFRGMFRC